MKEVFPEKSGMDDHQYLNIACGVICSGFDYFGCFDIV